GCDVQATPGGGVADARHAVLARQELVAGAARIPDRGQHGMLAEEPELIARDALGAATWSRGPPAGTGRRRAAFLGAALGATRPGAAGLAARSLGIAGPAIASR